jgi:hypothetical protein
MMRAPTAAGYALHYGQTQAPLVWVEPDSVHPNMWRIVWPDGRVSDMVNLARAKDAAMALCERGPPARDPRRLHWRLDRSNSLYGGRTRVLPADPTHRAPKRFCAEVLLANFNRVAPAAEALAAAGCEYEIDHDAIDPDGPAVFGLITGVSSLPEGEIGLWLTSVLRGCGADIVEWGYGEPWKIGD